MTLIEVPVRVRYGLDGLIDWQHNQVIAARFTGRSVEASVLAGLGLHFVHGLFQGMFFVVVLLLLPMQGPSWLLGAGFGVFLFVLTRPSSNL